MRVLWLNDIGGDLPDEYGIANGAIRGLPLDWFLAGAGSVRLQGVDAFGRRLRLPTTTPALTPARIAFVRGSLKPSYSKPTIAELLREGSDPWSLESTRSGRLRSLELKWRSGTKELATLEQRVCLAAAEHRSGANYSLPYESGVPAPHTTRPSDQSQLHVLARLFRDGSEQALQSLETFGSSDLVRLVALLGAFNPISLRCHAILVERDGSRLLPGLESRWREAGGMAFSLLGDTFGESSVICVRMIGLSSLQRLLRSYQNRVLGATVTGDTCCVYLEGGVEAARDSLRQVAGLKLVYSNGDRPLLLADILPWVDFRLDSVVMASMQELLRESGWSFNTVSTDDGPVVGGGDRWWSANVTAARFVEQAAREVDVDIFPIDVTGRICGDINDVLTAPQFFALGA